MRPPDAYASRRLERGRLRYEQGHKSELLYWLNWCLINDVQVPQWVKEGLNKAWIAAVSYRIKSWDQVFDRPVPKGTWLATKRQNQKIALDVFSRVCDLHASDPREWPIGEKLFEKVGKEFRIKKTLVSELYYEVGRELQEQDLEEQEAEREAAEKEASAKK